MHFYKQPVAPWLKLVKGKIDDSHVGMLLRRSSTGPLGRQQYA